MPWLGSQVFWKCRDLRMNLIPDGRYRKIMSKKKACFLASKKMILFN